MFKIIGIGRCGNNLLDFLKNQNFQITKSRYEFISVNSLSDLENIDFNKSDRIFTLAGLGGDSGGSLTLRLNEKAISQKLMIKNLLILPFHYETNHKKANLDLEKLLMVNQDIEVYLQDKSLLENTSIKSVDERIFESLKRDTRTPWRNFIVENKINNIDYKALVSFWSKDYTITLIEPKYSLIADAHLPFIAPSRYDFKDAHCETSNIQDIKAIAQKALVGYVESEAVK